MILRHTFPFHSSQPALRTKGSVKGVVPLDGFLSEEETGRRMDDRQ